MSNMLKLIKPQSNIWNTSFGHKENKKLFMKKINLTNESNNNNNISYSEIKMKIIILKIIIKIISKK